MELMKYGFPTSDSSENQESFSLKSRKSCEFSTYSNGCIAKAKVNLSLLQNGLDEWQEKVVSHKKEIQAQLENKVISFEKSDQTANTIPKKLEAIKSGTELEICGQGVKQRQFVDKFLNCGENLLTVVDEVPKLQLNTIQNIYSLIERLDADRSAMAELLEKEKQRCERLREKIDSHAYKRIYELPKAVQEEHERCAYDVQELRWHCSFKSRVEERIKEKVKAAEIINKKILDEIEFVKENRPLIEDKLKVENEGMKLIENLQNETDQEVKQAEIELKKIETEFEQEKRKTDAEQKMLARQVLTLSTSLKAALNRHLQSQELHEKLSTEIVENVQAIAKKQETQESLDLNLVQAAELEKESEDKVTKVSGEVLEVTSAYQKLIEQTKSYEHTLYLKKEDLQKIEKHFHRVIVDKTSDLQKLIQKNKNFSKDILSLERKIDICEKQKQKDAKSVQRGLDERNKNHEDLKAIQEEVHAMQSKNEKLILKLESTRMKATEIEENLNVQYEALKKQLNDEAHARTILQARLSADQANFTKQKEDSTKKREKLLKTESDVQKAVEKINFQVEKLNAKCEEKSKTLEGMNNLLEQVLTKDRELKERLSSEIHILLLQETELKDKHALLHKELDEMESSTLETKKKLDDITSSSVMMDKLILANQTAIDDFNNELKELHIQIDSGQALETALTESLRQVQERHKTHHADHVAIVHKRQLVRDKLQKNILEALEENRDLAKQYVQLQNRHMSDKNKFISVYEKAFIAQEVLDDKKTLCDLHVRLHHALICYYELRGLQTRAGLSWFEKMTVNSNEKLEVIQKKLETAIRNISEFLNANNKSHDFIKLRSSAVKGERKLLEVGL